MPRSPWKPGPESGFNLIRSSGRPPAWTRRQTLVAEIVSGVLHTHPRPALAHGFASSGIAARISPPFGSGDGGPDGWWIILEPELHLGEDIVTPDVAGWRRLAMPEYPRVPIFTPPDRVSEVLSPSAGRIDCNEKRTDYGREGVSRPWFVDPDARTPEAFELGGGRWTLPATLADDAPVSLPPFDAITFLFDALWPPGTPVSG